MVWPNYCSSIIYPAFTGLVLSPALICPSKLPLKKLGSAIIFAYYRPAYAFKSLLRKHPNFFDSDKISSTPQSSFIHHPTATQKFFRLLLSTLYNQEAAAANNHRIQYIMTFPTIYFHKSRAHYFLNICVLLHQTLALPFQTL
jgi:hypothetical protein